MNYYGSQAAEGDFNISSGQTFGVDGMQVPSEINDSSQNEAEMSACFIIHNELINSRIAHGVFRS